MSDANCDEALDDWFVREVLSLERAVVQYLRRACRNPADVDDILQDAYARVYAAARKERPAYPKAFLFRTARNIVIDRARRADVIFIEAIADIDAAAVLWNEADAEQALSSRQELNALRAALETLPARRREVVALIKIEGCSQREAAERTGLSVSTIEKHVAQGMSDLAEALYGEGRPFEGETQGRGNIARFWRKWKQRKT